NTVGDVLPGATNTICTNMYASRAIELSGTGLTYDVHDVRIRYADKGLYLSMGSSGLMNVSHSQIGYATLGLFANTAKYNARNVLLYDLITAVNAGNLTTNAGENVTFHRNGSLKSSSSSSIVQCLTNCMIISVTNNVAYVGQNNTSNLVDTGIFQTVASG